MQKLLALALTFASAHAEVTSDAELDALVDADWWDAIDGSIDSARNVWSKPSSGPLDSDFSTNACSLKVYNNKDTLQWHMRYSKESLRFTDPSGYYLQFKNQEDADLFFDNANSNARIRMIQGGDDWNNDGGLTLFTDTQRIGRPDGTTPFHPQEARYELDCVAGECPSVEEDKYPTTCRTRENCRECFGEDNRCCGNSQNCLLCVAQSQCHDGDYKKKSVLKLSEIYDFTRSWSISELQSFTDKVVTRKLCRGEPNEEKQKVRTQVLCGEDKMNRRRDKQKRDLLASIINGAFGGNLRSSDLTQRDCTAWCVYNTEGSGHFRWQQDKQCWIKKGGSTCATNKAENNHGKCMKKSLSSFNPWRRD